AAGHAGQEVEGQGEHLEGDEHHDEVARGGEEQHAAGGEEHEREDLGLAHPGPLGLVLVRAAGPRGGLSGEGVLAPLGAVGDDEQADQRDERDDPLREQRGTVLDERAADDLAGALGLDAGPAPHDRHQRGRGGQRRQRHLDAAPRPAGHEPGDEHAEQACTEYDEDGRQGRPVDVRWDEVHFSLPSATAAAASLDPSEPASAAVSSELGCSIAASCATGRSTSMTGPGTKPRASIEATSGATTHFSRAPRTGSAARMTASTANAAATMFTRNVPRSTRYSGTKPDRPGSDSVARPATSQVPASTGVTRCMPP